MKQNTYGPSLVFGITHIDIACSNIERSRRLYESVLGFIVSGEGAGWTDLDAGGGVLARLIQVRAVERPCALRVRSADVAATLHALAGAGCTLVHDADRTPEQTLEGSVVDPDGHSLCIWRPLSEDEFETVPELPKALVWTEDADALLKQLLRAVPALFRSLARRKVVRVVEMLAESAHHVTREEVIRGYILASPKVTRARNRKPLQDAGIDIDRYQADWDAD